MGRHVRRLLLFAIQYPGWSTYGKDPSTVKAINTLCRDGFINVNRETRQFRIALPDRMFPTKTISVDVSEEVATDLLKDQEV